MEMSLVRKSLQRKHRFLAELEARMEGGEVEVNMAMLNITAKPEEKQQQRVDGNSKNKLVNNEVEEWDLGFGSLQVSDPSAQKDKLRAAGEVALLGRNVRERLRLGPRSRYRRKENTSTLRGR